MNIQYPEYQSTKIKKNGNTHHYGKQNNTCKTCNRQFVLNKTHTVSEGKKADQTYKIGLQGEGDVVCCTKRQISVG